MKKFFRWFKSGKRHKYINGGKGVISIFLAVLMLPFLTMADLLVETGRYHEAVSLLDESMDSAALSALSNYDKYLLERFGLMSVSQDMDISQTYNTYLNDNLSSISSWDTPRADITGKYALSDREVLMKQITETSKFSAPTALASDLKLSDLIAQLNNMKHLGNFFSVVESTGNAVDSMLTLAEDMEALQETAEQLETNIADYDGKYAALESSVNGLTEALKVQADAQEEVNNLRDRISSCTDEDTLSSLRSALSSAEAKLNQANEVVTQKQKEFVKARDAYAASIDIIIPELSDYQEKANKIVEDLNEVAGSYADLVIKTTSAATSEAMGVNDLDSDIDDLKRKIEECDNEERKEELIIARERLEAKKSEIDATGATIEGIGEAATEGKESFIGTVNDGMSEYNKDKVKQCSEALEEVKNNVKNLQPNNISKNFTLNKSQYYVNIEGLVSANAIKMIMESMDASMQQTGFWDTVKAMCSVFRSLFTSNGIYDSRLNAYIGANADYTKGDLDLVLDDISEMLNYFDSFQYGVIVGLVNVLAHLSDIFDCLCNLVTHLVNYLLGITVRAVTALRELLSENCGEKFLLDEYLLKTLANRNDMGAGGSISGGNDFTGFSFSDVPFGTCENINNVPIIGGLASIIQLLQDVVNGGNDVMFNGAELEYILVGSRSETINQTVIFMNLYFVRLIADIGKIATNIEVQEIAAMAASASFGIGEVVVYILYFLIEPLIDSILIVNKVETSLFKSVVYLTPSGIPLLLGKIISLGLSEEDNDNITTQAQMFTRTNAYSYTIGDQGICWDYENYLFVFMLLFGENETYLKRFQNIIKLEANEHYGQGTFNLNDTYTYLEASVNGKYNPILPLGNLSTNGMFSISRSRARGY